MTGSAWNSLRMVTHPIEWLKDALRLYGLEWFCKRYYGIYTGLVVDNNDPENRGRCRIMIPAVRQMLPEDVLDDAWALPCMNGMGDLTETGQIGGVFWPPDEGMQVWVVFQGGDPAFPVYLGGYFTQNKVSDTFDAENALKKGLRTQTGHFLRMSDDPEDLHITIGKGDGTADGNPSPMFLSMTKEGHFLATNELGSTFFMNGEKPETSILTANEDGEVTSMLMLGDDKITLATKSGGAYGIDGKDHTFTGDNVVADCANQLAANAGTVMLGKGATEPVPRGLRLVTAWLAHQHVITTPAPGSPTPINPAIPPPMLYNELSDKVFIA